MHPLPSGWHALFINGWHALTIGKGVAGSGAEDGSTPIAPLWACHTIAWSVAILSAGPVKGPISPDSSMTLCHGRRRLCCPNSPVNLELVVFEKIAPGVGIGGRFAPNSRLWWAARRGRLA